MPTGRTDVKLLGAALLISSLIACRGPGDTVPGNSDQPSEPRSGYAALTGQGPWTATSTSGVRVTISVGSTPLTEGPVALAISVVASPSVPAPMSVDFTSPTMPTHGVMRVPVTKSGPGSHEASLEVPMAGLWLFYVNLDDGADTAEFAFDIAAADGSVEHQHAPS